MQAMKRGHLLVPWYEGPRRPRAGAFLPRQRVAEFPPHVVAECLQTPDNLRMLIGDVLAFADIGVEIVQFQPTAFDLVAVARGDAHHAGILNAGGRQLVEVGWLAVLARLARHHQVRVREVQLPRPRAYRVQLLAVVEEECFVRRFGAGAQPMAAIAKHYPPEKFARKRSYPAFSNSSLDQRLGNGDPKDGDLEGGINLGFAWQDVLDEEGRWAVTLSNDLAKDDMTVDVTPRRCQKYKARPGEPFRWTTSSGGAGAVTADEHGLVTVPRVAIQAGKSTNLTISSGK